MNSLNLTYDEVFRLGAVPLPFPSFIFHSDDQTREECIELKLFGTNAGRRSYYSPIVAGQILYLLNYSTKTIEGPFHATCSAKTGIVPTAWGGRYPFQVLVAPGLPPFLQALLPARLTPAQGQPATATLKRSAVTDRLGDKKHNLMSLSKEEGGLILHLFLESLAEAKTTARPQNSPPPSLLLPTPAATMSRMKKPCKFWPVGKCRKGASCMFIHEKLHLPQKTPSPSAPAPPPAPSPLASTIHQKSSPKPTAETPLKKKLCVFFLQGKCLKGGDCMFVHPPPASILEMCQYVADNRKCALGNACPYRHSNYSSDDQDRRRLWEYQQRARLVSEPPLAANTAQAPSSSAPPPHSLQTRSSSSAPSAHAAGLGSFEALGLQRPVARDPLTRNLASHTVFVIDKSKSMKSRDVLATSSGTKCEPISRNAAVFDVLLQLLYHQESVGDHGPDDVYSVVTFSDVSRVHFKYKTLSEVKVLLRDVRDDVPASQGYYLLALQAVKELLSERLALSSKATMVLFMSDGKPSDTYPSSTLTSTLVSATKSSFDVSLAAARAGRTIFSFRAVGLGSAQEFDVLSAMATELPHGLGRFDHSGLNVLELRKTISEFSSSLTDSRLSSKQIGPARPLREVSIDRSLGKGVLGKEKTMTMKRHKAWLYDAPTPDEVKKEEQKKAAEAAQEQAEREAIAEAEAARKQQTDKAMKEAIALRKSKVAAAKRNNASSLATAKSAQKGGGAGECDGRESDKALIKTLDETDKSRSPYPESAKKKEREVNAEASEGEKWKEGEKKAAPASVLATPEHMPVDLDPRAPSLLYFTDYSSVHLMLKVPKTVHMQSSAQLEESAKNRSHVCFCNCLMLEYELFSEDHSEVLLSDVIYFDAWHDPTRHPTFSIGLPPGLDCGNFTVRARLLRGESSSSRIKKEEAALAAAAEREAVAAENAATRVRKAGDDAVAALDFTSRIFKEKHWRAKAEETERSAIAAETARLVFGDDNKLSFSNTSSDRIYLGDWSPYSNVMRQPSEESASIMKISAKAIQGAEQKVRKGVANAQRRLDAAVDKDTPSTLDAYHQSYGELHKYVVRLGNKIDEYSRERQFSYDEHCRSANATRDMSLSILAQLEERLTRKGSVKAWLQAATVNARKKSSKMEIGYASAEWEKKEGEREERQAEEKEREWTKSRKFFRFLSSLLEKGLFNDWVADRDNTKAVVAMSCDGADLNRLYQMLVAEKWSLEICFHTAQLILQRDDWFNEKQRKTLKEIAGGILREERARDIAEGHERSLIDEVGIPVQTAGTIERKAEEKQISWIPRAECEVEISATAFGSGGERNAFLLTFISDASDTCDKGTHYYVAKEDKHESDSSDELMFHWKKLYAQNVCKVAAEQFTTILAGLRGTAPYTITYESAFILRTIGKGEPRSFFVERFIEGNMIKWNTNSGFVRQTPPSKVPNKAAQHTHLLSVFEEDDEENNDDEEYLEDKLKAKTSLTHEALDVPQAFSHWSHSSSLEQLGDESCHLICDVQGFYDESKQLFELIDPVIHSAEGLHAYARTDHGKAGIDNFFATHRCNRLCRALNLPEVRPSISRESSAASSTSVVYTSEIPKSVPTSEIPVIKTHHLKDRQEERLIATKELQRAVKHGEKVLGRDGAIKHVHQGVAYITDKTEKLGITGYRK